MCLVLLGRCSPFFTPLCVSRSPWSLFTLLSPVAPLSSRLQCHQPASFFPPLHPSLHAYIAISQKCQAEASLPSNKRRANTHHAKRQGPENRACRLREGNGNITEHKSQNREAAQGQYPCIPFRSFFVSVGRRVEHNALTVAHLVVAADPRGTSARSNICIGLVHVCGLTAALGC